MAKTVTDLAGLIRRSLDAVGRTESTVLTAFTDGCPGLRRILLDAGVEGLPILDWFHVAMRLQHLTQIAGGLSSDGPERAAAKAVIVEEVERLRWRLWNGKAKDAKVSIDRIRAVMHHFRGEPGSRRSIAPSRKLWTALEALDGYLVGQSDRLVDYGERHRAGLRVGTALTEGTANFLVNRRMNKSQQMRWSRRGADRLLQVRCAVYNGTLGAASGSASSPRTTRSPSRRRSLTPNRAAVPPASALSRRRIGAKRGSGIATESRHSVRATRQGSNLFPLDLVQRDFIAGAIIELGRARAFVCSHGLSVFERAAGFEVGGDAGRAEHVAAECKYLHYPAGPARRRIMR